MIRQSSAVARLAATTAVLSALVVALGIQLGGGRVDLTTEKVERLRKCITEDMSPGTYLYRMTQDGFRGGTNGDIDTARIACARKTVGSTHSANEVKAVLGAIFAEAERSSRVRYLCHDLAHEFGAWAYREIREASLFVGFDRCGFGYYHGVMQTAMETGQTTDNLLTLHDFCIRLAARPKDGMDTGIYSFCSHGVGHAIATKLKDLRSGYELCTAMDLEQQPSSRLNESGQRDMMFVPAEQECFAGFMNERMQQQAGFRTQIRNNFEAETGIRDCPSVPPAYSERCMSYVVYYSATPTETVRVLCTQLVDEYLKAGCWEGVGFRAGRMLVDPNSVRGDRELAGGLTLGSVESDPASAAQFLRRVCDGQYRDSCVRRFSLETLQRLQSPQVMSALCERLENSENWKRSCDTVVRGVGRYQGGAD